MMMMVMIIIIRRRRRGRILIIKTISHFMNYFGFDCSSRTLCIYIYIIFHSQLGWSGGAMVLGKLPVPGRPSYLE